MLPLALSSSSSTGVSMVAWALLGVVLAFSNLVVHAIPNVKYGGDVDGDEVVIDQLEDYIRSHDSQHLYGIDSEPPHPRQHYEHSREKIKFAVSPKDPRYYEPIIPQDQGPDLVEDLEEEERVGGGRVAGGVGGGGGGGEGGAPPLPYLPPNLAVLRSRLQSQREYPGEIPQYQDEDTQYPSNQYVQEDQYNDPYPVRDPGYLNIRQQPDLVSFYGDPPLEVLEELRNERTQRMHRPHIPEEVREEVERDEAKRMMASIGSSGGEEVDEDASAAAAAAPLKKEGEEKKASIKAATSQPEAVNYLNRSPAHAEHSDYILKESDRQSEISDIYFTAIVAGCTAAAVCAVIGAGMCWYRLNKSHRAAQDAEYPAYGVTGPNKDLSPTSGDRKLAQSAHMYHYQHQKQQMIALEKSAGGERHGSASDVDSDEEGEENEYTVYECPGLAPTGEMEVKNPLFQDDPTPATPSLRKEQDDDDEEDDEDEEQKAK